MGLLLLLPAPPYGQASWLRGRVDLVKRPLR